MPWFARNFLKNSPEIVFSEIPGKNIHLIEDKTRQISGQKDEYSPTKKIKQFYTQINLPFSSGSDQ